MREIKFRAWDEVTKELSEGFDIQGQSVRVQFKSMNTTLDHVLLLPGRFKLVQFTGLKDKNGKEIYEGDICVWPSGINREIIWDNVNACFSTPLHTLQVERGKSTVIGGHLEVIGNIYENPELLKV